MCSLLFSTILPKADINYINEHLKYRGPDATNYLTHNNHFYLHNLLSLTGAFTPQPVIQEDIAVLFNGEIYDYKEHGDYDNDTKCIIPLYKQHGVDFIKKVNGEFAICLVDYVLEIIIVTTDVHGTKPIFLSTSGGVGVATYYSALERIGFAKESIKKVPANTTLIIDFQGKILESLPIKEYDLNQYKTTYDDFFKAFTDSIVRRAVSNIREKLFLGLSSGYDSGVLACSLMKLGVPFKAYSVVGSENVRVLKERWAKFGGKFDLEVTVITPELRAKAHQHLLDTTCKWNYCIYSPLTDYNEFDLALADDHGSNSLSHVCSLAKRDGKKIFLETTGCDEIYGDYPSYKHTNFHGIFPENLKDIFPVFENGAWRHRGWPSFFSSTTQSYIEKCEWTGGSWGIETRYPFLDPQVVQEFLWLKAELKNRNYKAPLYEFLIANDYPFEKGQKIGF